MPPCSATPAIDQPQSVLESVPTVSSDKPKNLADLANGATSAITDDGGRQPGVLATVFSVDVLDDFLASFVLEIDVDIGRLAAFRRDETFEQEIDLSQDSLP